MTQPVKTVAEKLRYHRKASALTHQQVADALNIDRTTYTKYETGASEPSLNTLTKLAVIFNVSPLELLPQQDHEKVPRKLKDSPRADSPIYQLSKDERGLIAKYRALSPSDKLQAYELIGKLSKKG